jgi:hypothetical protein
MAFALLQTIISNDRRPYDSEFVSTFGTGDNHWADFWTLCQGGLVSGRVCCFNGV